MARAKKEEGQDLSPEAQAWAEKQKEGDGTPPEEPTPADEPSPPEGDEGGAEAEPEAELDGDQPDQATSAAVGYDGGVNLREKYLRGDIRDAVLRNVKAMPGSPWPTMSEQEQRDLAMICEQLAGNIVRNAVRIVTRYEFPRAAVRLADMKVIGGDKARIEAKIVATNDDESRNVLGGHVGGFATLLCIDSETFHQAEHDVDIDADEPDLPMGDEDDDVDIPLDDAEAALRDAGKVSVAALQKAMGVSYAAASRAMVALQAKGIVTEPGRDGVRNFVDDDKPVMDGSGAARAAASEAVAAE